jgi:hypothetical protein
MEWDPVLDGRSAPEGVLAILAERHEAEGIADDVRKEGRPIVVRPYFAVRGDEVIR